MSAENSPRIYTLPLFPLHSVLFPHFLLQLHIFEERYKVMINGCIERNSPFGVILIREGEEVGEPARPFDVGCITHIVGVQKLDDGRMNLLAAGESRFRLLETSEVDLPYLVGRVEEFEDEEADEEELRGPAAGLNGAFMRYLELLAAHVDEPVPEVELPDDPRLLTYCVASVAMIPALDKQHLLEMTDTRLRLETERQWLQEQIAALEELARAAPAPTVTARPMDVESETWRRFRDDTRN